VRDDGVLKVFEAKTLIDSMEDRAKVYKDLREKIDTLKKEFTDIVQLDDALQGKGADAIKGFYQGQIDVAEALLRLIDMQIAFLNSVSGAVSDVDLSGDTVVDVNFLESDLFIHASNHIAMVESQQKDLQKIFNGIDDIVSLEAFSTDQFNSAMEDTKRKRENTIQAVDSLDQQLLEEYKVSESAEFHIGALFQQLLEATAQDNTISPIHFDAQAYKASEAYQLTDEVKQYADDYLTYKEEQERFREELKKAEELENRPFHEKAWDTVKTLTGEITGYYDFLRASEGVDPVTGEKLTDGQRVAAGAMASAGLIPIVGWGGRLLKGGSAIYKTAKGMNAADQALDVYKTTKTFSNLEKAELGIYGLTSANGLSEYITGKDMFGNELTDIQRQQSLYYSILGPALMAAPFVPTLIKNGKLVKDETVTQIHKLTTKTKSGALYVYDEVKGGMQVLLQNQNMNFAFAGANGVKPLLSNVMNSKEITKRIEEVVSKFSFSKRFGGNKSSVDSGIDIAKSTGKVYPTRQIDSVTEAHIINRVKELRGSLTSKYKKSGNFAVAEVNVSGISKTEFYAQSSINKLKGSLEDKVPNISLQPENPMFKATKAVGKDGESYLRDTDTEYKILNDIASLLGENTQATGKIKLFTELDTCDSCSKVIAEFATKYKNIELEVIHNNGNRIMP